MSWISSVGQTQRKDIFLPSWSFLSSEVGDKSEISQPVLHRFRWCCPDEKSVARLRVWFLLFFPCGQDDLEKKSHELLRLADTCMCFPWPPVSGAFWAEWNRERLKCCFICCCICMDWWYISYSLSHHYGKLPDCGKGHGSGSLSMVWLVFILMNQEVKRAPATLCPQSPTPSDSF